MKNGVLEMRVPLGLLAPTVGSMRKNAAHLEEQEKSSVPTQFGGQWMALCEDTGLLAIANGRVVDLYDAKSITTAVARSPDCRPRDQIEEVEDLHLPSAGQIVLGDHLEAYISEIQEIAAYATCVAFVAPGFLLIAVAVTETPSVWLCGFRMYSRSVTASHRYGPSSLLVHCAFEDPIAGVDAIAVLEPVATDCFTSREAGAALVLFQGKSSSSFGVFQWAERFSDRVLSLARLPTSDAALSAIAAASDGRWLAISDVCGAVSVLDFRRFAWADHQKPGIRMPSTGRRLVLGESFRLGRLSQRDHSLDSVRLMCQAHAANSFGFSLRWWNHGGEKRSSRHLMIGQNDGALVIMTLVKLKNTSERYTLGLKTVEIYPAIRALKNDPIIYVSSSVNTATEKIEFSTITTTSWRRWNIENEHSENDGDPRFRWPTLTDSLDLWSSSFSTPAIHGSVLLSHNSSVALHLAELSPSLSINHDRFAPWLLLLTRNSIRVLGCISERPPHDNSKRTLKVPQASNQPEFLHTFNDKQKEAETRQGEASLISGDSPTGQPAGGVLVTLQDRYGLPPMPLQKESSSVDGSFSSPDQMSFAQSSRHKHLTKKDFDTRLAAMTERVDNLHTNLRMLRKSFQIFTNDVQQHMKFISDTLEELQKSSESDGFFRSTRQSASHHKMKSILQAHDPRARFDDSAALERRRHATRSDNNNGEAIPHLKEKYDPDHPDADWGGYVQRGYKKKAEYNEHSATRQNLVVDAKGGIVPDSAAPVVPISFSGKKMFDSSQVPAGDPVVPGIQFQSAVYQVGPGADLSCSNWKTSYEAQTSLEATPKDVYALGTRKNSQHKRHVTPMYEKAANTGYRTNRLSSPGAIDNNLSEASSRGDSPSGLVGSDSTGSLSGRRFEPRKSLLAGIGKLVAAEDFSDKLVRPEHHLPQGFTDPTKKTLIVENHHNITLGYTGRKSSFR